MHCDHVSKVWFGSKLSINFHNTQASFAEWLSYSIINLKDEDLIYIAAITYGIWFARNQQVFENKNLTDSEVFRIADTNINDYIKATNGDDLDHSSKGQSRSTSHQQGSTRNRTNQWRRPDEGVIKINSDASLTTAGKWGLGVTCRDNTGMIVAAATWEVPGNNDPLLERPMCCTMMCVSQWIAASSQSSSKVITKVSLSFLVVTTKSLETMWVILLEELSVIGTPSDFVISSTSIGNLISQPTILLYGPIASPT
jgi:hypothetical protein